MEMGKVRCPRCNHPYQAGPLFDHHPRKCKGCGVLLVEWNIMNYVYIISPESAPPVIQTLVAFLAPLTEYEAAHCLIELLRFLDVKPPT
jgi:hypothetical protein